MNPKSATVSFRVSTDLYRRGEEVASAQGKTIGELSRSQFLKALAEPGPDDLPPSSVADDPKVQALVRRAVWAVVVALGPWDEKQTEAFVEEFLP